MKVDFNKLYDNLRIKKIVKFRKKKRFKILKKKNPIKFLNMALGVYLK